MVWRARFDPGHMLASAIVGGAASVLGGGKFLNGAITSAFAYAATAKYGEDSVEQIIDGPSANGTTQQGNPSVPYKLAILNPEGEAHGSYSTFYYQLEDVNGTPITGSGYSLEETITPADENSPMTNTNTSNGQFVPMKNGVAADIVGWARKDPLTGQFVSVTPPPTAIYFYDQTFAVQYQGQIYNLNELFVHENFSVNGVVKNYVFAPSN